MTSTSAGYPIPESAYLRLGGLPLDGEEWLSFCAEEGLERQDDEDGNVYLADEGKIKVIFGRSLKDILPAVRERMDRPVDAKEVEFQTFDNAYLPAVARLAGLAWTRFGGSLSATPELRQWVNQGLVHLTPLLEPAALTFAPRERPSSLSADL